METNDGPPGHHKLPRGEAGKPLTSSKLCCRLRPTEPLPTDADAPVRSRCACCGCSRSRELTPEPPPPPTTTPFDTGPPPPDVLPRLPLPPGDRLYPPPPVRAICRLAARDAGSTPNELAMRSSSTCALCALPAVRCKSAGALAPAAAGLPPLPAWLASAESSKVPFSIQSFGPFWPPSEAVANTPLLLRAMPAAAAKADAPGPAGAAAKAGSTGPSGGCSAPGGGPCKQAAHPLANNV